MSQSPDEKLESLGYSFEKRLSRGAIYQPVVIDGTTAYVSGCVPFDGDKNLVSKGKVPSQVSLEDARKAAALSPPTCFDCSTRNSAPSIASSAR